MPVLIIQRVVACYNGWGYEYQLSRILFYSILSTVTSTEGLQQHVLHVMVLYVAIVVYA